MDRTLLSALRRGTLQALQHHNARLRPSFVFQVLDTWHLSFRLVAVTSGVTEAGWQATHRSASTDRQTQTKVVEDQLRLATIDCSLQRVNLQLFLPQADPGSRTLRIPTILPCS